MCVSIPINTELLLIEFMEYANDDCDEAFQRLRLFLDDKASDWPASLRESSENRPPPFDYLRGQLRKFIDRHVAALALDLIPRSALSVRETIESNKQFRKKWALDQNQQTRTSFERAMQCYFFDFISEFIPQSLLIQLLHHYNIDPPRTFSTPLADCPNTGKTEPARKKTKQSEALAKEAASCKSITSFFSRKPSSKN